MLKYILILIWDFRMLFPEKKEEKEKKVGFV